MDMSTSWIFIGGGLQSSPDVKSTACCVHVGKTMCNCLKPQSDAFAGFLPLDITGGSGKVERC